MSRAATSVKASGFAARCSLLLRLLAAIFGSYACAASLASAGAALLVLLAGMARSEAVYLTAMLALLVYLALLLWGFSASRLWRVWAFMLGGTALGLLLQGVLAWLPASTPLGA